MTQAGARVAQLNRAVGIRRAPGPAFDAWLDQYCSAPMYFVTISGKRPAAARGDGRSESGLRRSVWSICQKLGLLALRKECNWRVEDRNQIAGEAKDPLPQHDTIAAPIADPAPFPVDHSDAARH
jgi:hypothetical protein